MFSKIAIASSLLAVASAQQAGTLTPEVHPPLTWQTCTAPGACTTMNGQVVIDANWRWTHSVSGSTNCYTGNKWDATLCPDDVTCAANCAVDGANYQSTYGITASGNSLRLNFVTTGSNTNIGSRLFLMADSTHYQMFHLLNQEFTFDVDVSNLPCGLNGALYMSGMVADGGKSTYPGAKAGAQYGLGYCDAQCPRDLKFINGQANVEGWTPESNSANSGNGRYGSCCAEMDIWEANSISAALTPHSSDDITQTRCDGNACGGTYSTPRYGGPTDPDGCDFNSYRMGNKNFYGPGMVVDTKKPFTVVTQFLTDSGTASGNLNEIKRFYVQNGVVIPNSQSTIPGITGNSINPAFCKATKTVFNNTDVFNAHGGFASMTKAYQAGMVLVLSLWDDYADSMLWLDSNDPASGDPSVPGVARGTCPTTGGLPSQVESQNANAYVIYSNIKTGPINSTFSGTPYGGTGGTGGSSSIISSSTKATSSTKTSGMTTSTTKVSTTSSVASSPTGTGSVPRYGQCGGISYTGPTGCASGSTCVVLNPYYSQCQ